MKPISPAESNELFVDTLFRGSSRILLSSDEDIAQDLFAEFDTGAVSFLHEWTLDRLLENGFIDAEIRALSLELREKALFLLENKRDLSLVKTDAQWLEMFRLADKIINLKNRFDASQNRLGGA